MPIRSIAQRGWIWQQVKERKWTKAEAEKWESETPKNKKLPARVAQRRQRTRRKA